MRYRRSDIVEGALRLLGDVGLPDLTMRRLGSELGVQPSAIYHHFPNKQALLGAVADEIVARGGVDEVPGADDWQQQAVGTCHALRSALLAYPDGADLVATMWAFGLGGRRPYDVLVPLLRSAGLADDMAATGARTLLHFVFGHSLDEQAHAQASRLGAIVTPPRDERDFDNGLSLVISGIEAVLQAGAAAAP